MTHDEAMQERDVSIYDLYIFAEWNSYPWKLKSITDKIKQSDIAYASFKYPILLRSNSLIHENMRGKLINLIKPLQDKLNNYRDSKFINILNTKVTKPKIQELIFQYEHYPQYKQLIWNVTNIDDKDMPISLAPAIFSLNTLKFETEINGLLRDNNRILYTLIENIFIQFIAMFEACLETKLLNNNEYKQLSVIIKIQDYQFENENNITGRWHSEGNQQDDIAVVGLYYFDITQNKQLKFDDNYLEILIGDINNNNNNNNKLKINIKQNDCLVFRNHGIEHRAILSTKCSVDKSISSVSRKVLTFFLLNPDNVMFRNRGCKYYNFVNFPSKIKMFIDVWPNLYHQTVTENISNDIINLIKIFAFGDNEYQKKEMIQFRENRLLHKFGTYIDSNGLTAIYTNSGD